MKPLIMKTIYLTIALLLSKEIFCRGVIPIKRDNELAIVYIILCVILIVLNYLYTVIRGTDFNKNNIMGMGTIAFFLTIIYWIFR